MLDQLTSTDKKPSCPGWTDDFNAAPPGFREISLKEFVQNTNFFRYSPECIEHRQICHGEWYEQSGRKTMLGVTIYWYWDGTGVALHGDYWGGRFDNGTDNKDGKHFRVFACGCDHQYEHFSNDGHCLNTYRRLGRCLILAMDHHQADILRRSGY